MPSLFRSISQRFRRSTKRRPNGQPGSSGYQQGLNAPEMDHRRQCQCKVMLLDGADLNIVTSKNALGQEVYDQVFYALDLEERDYFGLLFMDHYQVQHWLDPMKKLSKQVPIGPPYTFRFNVKFFSSEPSNLREELTRYQFFLQLKQDIQTGKLECLKETAIELAALALQSEFGDYNPGEHTPAFVSEFRFHPEQDEEMEIAILEKFVACRGQSPATAELNYLNKARWIELYGVDMHVVEGKDGNTYRLGLTPSGMLVFDGNQKIGLFFWEKIQKLDFRNKKLTLVVEEDADQAVQLHTFVFNLASHKACKHLWKCAIEYHTFFRLKFHQAKQRKTSQLFRLGSTFKYRGRTEYETVHKDGGRLSRRQTSTFERRPSQRYGPRQTLLNKRLQIRNELKQQVAASAGLAIPDVVVPAESSKPAVETKRPEEARIPVGVPVTQSEIGVLGTRPSPLGSSATPQSERPPNKIAAAEARLDSLIFKTPREASNLPPTTVKQLDESPTAARRLLHNGTRVTSTAGGDSIHPNTPKCDPRIDVRLNALNDGDRWAVPPSAHVTTIAVGSTPMHADGPRNGAVSSTPVSRIPKYTSNGPSSSGGHSPPTTSSLSPSATPAVTGIGSPAAATTAPQSLIPRMAGGTTSPAAADVHCRTADVVQTSTVVPSGLRKPPAVSPLTNGFGFTPSSGPVTPASQQPSGGAPLELLNGEVKPLAAPSSASVSFSSFSSSRSPPNTSHSAPTCTPAPCPPSMPTSNKSSSPPAVAHLPREHSSMLMMPVTNRNPESATTTITATTTTTTTTATATAASTTIATVNAVGVTKNSPASQHLSTHQFPGAPLVEKAEEKPDIVGIQTTSYSDVDRQPLQQQRSKLPVRSEPTPKGSPASATSSPTAKLDEKTSQSRIPKMTSGHKPHQYFGQSPHIEKSGCGVTTFIPIVRTGLPSTQSRIITDL